MNVTSPAAGNSTPGINANAKIHVAEADDQTRIAQQETLDKQRHSLEQVLAGEADSVDISDEARALSRAAQELAQKEAAIEEQAENTSVVVRAEKETTPAAEKSPTVVTPSSDIYGKENRKTTGEYYTSVLEDLRSQYSEEEAMRKFDEFMRSEGFELDDGSSSVLVSSTYGMGLNSPRAGYLSGYTMGMKDVYEQLRNAGGGGGYGGSDNRLTLNSQLGVAMVNGKPQIYASSTASYAAYNSAASRDLVAGWSGRYADQFSSQSGIEHDAYREALGLGQYSSLVAADQDLGSTLSNLLGAEMKKAGYEFSGDDRFSFNLTYDEDGNATGVNVDFIPDDWEKFDGEKGWDKYESLCNKLNSALSKAMKNDSSLFEQFVAFDNSVEMTDPASLEGAFSDGDRGVSYGVGRSYSISASQPDTLAMVEHLGIIQSGYNYVKKTDAFDPEADSFMISAPHDLPDRVENPEYAEQQEAIRDAVNEAIENGSPIQSEIDKETYEANRGGPLSALRDQPVDVGMYDARTGKRIDNVSDYEQEEEESTENVAEEEENEAETTPSALESAYAEKDAARNKVFQGMLSRARMNNDFRTADMLNSLMGSLSEYYRKQSKSQIKMW